MRRQAGGLVVAIGLGLATVAGVAACATQGDTATTSPQTSASVAAGSSAPASSTRASSAPASSTPASSAPGSSTPGSSAVGGKAAFLTKGNAICKTMNADSAALTKKYNQGAKSAADLQKLLDGNGDLIQQSVADLQALPQPAGDEAQLAAMYADVEELASLSHQLAAAAGQGDEALMQQLQTTGKAKQTTANAEFTAYGLTECGKGS